LKQAVSKETAFFASMPLLTFSFEFVPGFDWSVVGFPGELWNSEFIVVRKAGTNTFRVKAHFMFK
jgi:hypothetical protein